MIDFHCHLDLYPDPLAAAHGAQQSRAYILSVTTTPKAFRRTKALAKGSERIRTALGLHPEVAHERYRELALFEAFLPEAGYVGEVGLDGSPHVREHATIQKKVFSSILSLSAKQGGRIFSIHSRRAADDVLDSLAREPNAGIPVLHWFSGSKTQLKRAVDQGCWFSVGAPMARSASGRGILAALPKDRVLTETDGPFGRDGDRSLEPGEVSAAYKALSQLWAMPTGEVERLIRANLNRLARSLEETRRAPA